MKTRTRGTYLHAAWSIAATLSLFLAGCEKKAPGPIRVGALFDLTGSTSEISIPYAEGVRDYVRYLNERGGINGRQIQLVERDYGYIIERAESVYGQLVNEEKVVAIMGWGTGDTEALRPRIAEDRIPFMSASYSESLTNPKEAPYNFLIGVTYSDQMRIALRYILDGWKDPSRRPRVAFIYNDTGFGRSPIQAGRDYAKAHGIDLVDEQIVSLAAVDVTFAMRAMSDKNPDYAIVQETTASGSVILLGAQKLKLPTRFIMLNWTADEKLISLAGPAAEGVLGTVPFTFIHEDVPGLAEIRGYIRAKGLDPSAMNIRYVQGWVTMKVMAEGVRRAGGSPTGEGIRKGLESLAAFDTGGLTVPITFTSGSHKGAAALRISQVKDGQWKPVTDYIQAQP